MKKEVVKSTSKQIDKVSEVYQSLLDNPQVISDQFIPGTPIKADDYVVANENLKKYVVLDNLIASGEANFFSDERIPINAFRLMMVAISEVKMDDDHFRTLFVPYKDLAYIYNLDPRNIKKNKDKIRDSIEATKLRFTIDTEKGAREFSIPFVGLIAIDDVEKGFYIRLNQYIAPFFIQLQDSFTRVEQQVLAQLATVPSMQLILLIKQKLMSDWPTGNEVCTVEISISQLRLATGCENSYVNKNNDFIRYIIDPFIENVARIPNWIDVKYELIKSGSGHTITAVKFILQSKTRLLYLKHNSVDKAEMMQHKVRLMKKWQKMSSGEKSSWSDFDEFVAYHLTYGDGE